MFQSKIEPVTVLVDTKITEAWQHSYFTLNHVAVSSIPTAEKIQGMIVNPVLCATIHLGKKAVACGLGLGKLLCQTLLARAKENGATIGYLQEVDNNVVAKHLYERLGFVSRYSYLYRAQA